MPLCVRDQVPNQHDSRTTKTNAFDSHVLRFAGVHEYAQHEAWT